MIENEYVDQAQEHAEHVAGSATEFQNCFTEARQAVSRLQAESATKIQAALARGLFVVVKDLVYHCRATDAVAGSFVYFVQAFECISDARSYVHGAIYQNSDSGDPEDYSHRVLNDPAPLTYAPPAPAATDDNDLPF